MSSELLLLFPISIGCDVLGQVLFKLGADRLDGAEPTERVPLGAWLPPLVWIGLGIATYALETFVWLRILALAPLSVAFPVAATNFLGVTLASRFLFKEQVGRWQWLGVAFVTLGVIAVAST